MTSGASSAGNGFAQNDLKHTTGVLSMARAMHPDSAGSQFFIMVAPAPHLDGQYAAFGQVTEGVEEAIRISEVPTDWNDKPKTPVVIQSIRVDTQGVDYPARDEVRQLKEGGVPMKTAIITGASSGLGREFARQLTDVFPEIECCWLIARREDRLEEVAREMVGVETVLPPPGPV